MFNPNDLTTDKVIKILTSEYAEIFLKEAFAYYSLNTRLLTKDNMEMFKKHLDKLSAQKNKQGKTNEEIIELHFIYLINKICLCLGFYDQETSTILISKKYQKWMARELTCQYLSISLERNAIMRQTIPEFYSQLHPKENSLDKTITGDTKYLCDNRNIYFENTKIQKEYKKQLYPNNSEKGLNDFNDDKFNILELYTFEAMHQVEAIKLFLKLFFNNVVPYEVQSNKCKQSIKTDGIKEAYLCFSESLQEIRKDGSLKKFLNSTQMIDGSLVKSDRHFVCSWFAFRKLELSYRFCMTATVAQQKLIKTHNSFSSEHLKTMYCIIPLPFFYDANENLDLSPFWVNEKIVKSLCQKDLPVEKEEELEAIRIVANIALTIYTNLYIPENQVFWNDNSFSRVADYLKKVCNIYDYLSCINICDNEKYWEVVAETYKEISSDLSLKNYRKIKSEGI